MIRHPRAVIHRFGDIGTTLPFNRMASEVVDLQVKQSCRVAFHIAFRFPLVWNAVRTYLPMQRMTQRINILSVMNVFEGDEISLVCLAFTFCQYSMSSSSSDLHLLSVIAQYPNVQGLFAALDNAIQSSFSVLQSDMGSKLIPSQRINLPSCKNV